jgi:hypothetical protein
MFIDFFIEFKGMFRKFLIDINPLLKGSDKEVEKKKVDLELEYERKKREYEKEIDKINSKIENLKKSGRLTKEEVDRKLEEFEKKKKEAEEKIKELDEKKGQVSKDKMIARRIVSREDVEYLDKLYEDKEKRANLEKMFGILYALREFKVGDKINFDLSQLDNEELKKFFGKDYKKIKSKIEHIIDYAESDETSKKWVEKFKTRVNVEAFVNRYKISDNSNIAGSNIQDVKKLSQKNEVDNEKQINKGDLSNKTSSVEIKMQEPIRNNSIFDNVISPSISYLS